MTDQTPPSFTITGRASLVNVIDAAQKRMRLSDRALLQRAGLSAHALTTMRAKTGDVYVSTAAALLNETGYDLVAQPVGQRNLALGQITRLRHKLTDLRTSVLNRRHHDDLRHEIEDILYWLDNS